MTLTNRIIRLLFCLLVAFSILWLTSLAAQTSSPAAQQSATDPMVRVEVIVFSHLTGRSDELRTDQLDDYSDVLDPLRLAEAHADTRASQDRFNQLTADVQTVDPQQLPNQNGPNQQGPSAGDQFVAYLADSELSDSMQAILNRLARSERYQPLTWRSWLQTAERGVSTPWVRLHNEEPLAFDEASDPWTTGKPPENIGNARLDDNGPDDANTALRDRPVHYELDGQLRLRQRQFLHVYFDLEWRQAAGRPAPVLEPMENDQPVRMNQHSTPNEWLIHRFEQSRIVRPEQIEYFDSAWLGAIVLISAIELPSPESALTTSSTTSVDGAMIEGSDD